MTEILLQDERLHLLPERAVWWPSQKTMILSDVHWGKSAHFRKHGIAIPGATQQQDGLRLAALISNYSAERLIIAGDLFHSRHNKEVDDFTHWRTAHTTLHIDFVRGNHDILTPQQYAPWQFSMHEEALTAPPFYITHDDAQHPTLFTIHGHLHPGIRIPGMSRPLPSFCISDRCMILPAFGSFTGCKLMQAAHFRHIYVIGEGKVLQLK